MSSLPGPSLVRSDSALLLAVRVPTPGTDSRHLILPLAKDLPETASLIKALASGVTEIRRYPPPKPSIGVLPSNAAIRVLKAQLGFGDYAPPSGASKPRSNICIGNTTGASTGLLGPLSRWSTARDRLGLVAWAYIRLRVHGQGASRPG